MEDLGHASIERLHSLLSSPSSRRSASNFVREGMLSCVLSGTTAARSASYIAVYMYFQVCHYQITIIRPLRISKSVEGRECQTVPQGCENTSLVGHRPSEATVAYVNIESNLFLEMFEGQLAFRLWYDADCRMANILPGSFSLVLGVFV